MNNKTTIEHILPTHETWRVRIDYWDNKALCVDKGVTWQDWQLSDEVAAFLKENDPNAQVWLDCGDWGDGDPIVDIQFTKRAVAEEFVKRWGVQ